MSGSAPRTILVVDENQGLSALIEKYLRRDGFATGHAADGNAALEWLAQSPADLLLLSVKLPDCDCDHIVEALEAKGIRIPFIIVAGHGDERRAASMMKRGALDYLMKDGTLLELLPAVVKQAIDQLDRRRIMLEAQVAYERLRKKYEMILDAAGEGICELDLDGRVTFLNPAGRRMLGYELSDLLGQDLAALAERPGQDADGQVRAGMDANTTFRSRDLLFWRKDGTSVPIESTSTPIRDGSRQIGSVFIFKDVSEHRKLEEKLQQSQKLEAIGQLAGGVAHDFNNLLTVISGYSELLATNKNLDRQASESVVEIQKATDRAINVTRKLLAFSRKETLRPRPTDLNEVIADISKLIRVSIGDDIALELNLEPRLHSVTVDSGQIESSILNLAVNARDAMPRGGRLTISTANFLIGTAQAARMTKLKPGPHVVLTVADTGVGMDAATRRHIFEPFFTTKEPGRGTGLGLPTVYGIVIQSGGDIDVESEPGRGTQFSVYLPQSGAAADRPARTVAAGPLAGRESILLVEDNDEVRTLTARLLTEYGYRVTHARSGTHALQLIESDATPVDLLLTDFIMPGIAGLELSASIARRWPKTRVLVMSANPDDALQRAWKAGTEPAFLAKPFTQDSLARKVREVLDRPMVPSKSPAVKAGRAVR